MRKKTPKRHFPAAAVQGGPTTAVRGIISVTMKGAGFVTHADFAEDIYIENGSLGTALHGDTVEVELYSRIERGRRLGAVSKVLERAKTEFVGTLERGNGAWRLTPDDRRVYTPFLITGKIPKTIAPNMKALIRMTGWKDARSIPEGEIVTVIGKKGDHDTEMKAIVLGKGFDLQFKKALEEEAKAIEKNKEITPEEIAKRRDFRDVMTCTIDPETAKDFDDAISFKDLGNGTYEIGVHIADVSHYVRPGSAIDEEARERGTSIYLVDRTIPMLPEVLSNDVCSLNPGENKLTYAAVLTINERGEVLERWFGKTVIHSDKRFTYEEAQKTIDTKEGPFAAELIKLNELAGAIRKERFKEGAIDFDQPEIRFRLDKHGHPLEVIRKERLETMRLIEEYMLLANREVATYVSDLAKKDPILKTAFIYRIHDTPNPERIEELSIFIRALGYDFKTREGIVTAKDLNKLFQELNGKPEETLIKTATIRSMAKAIYSTKNIGHFGLAFKFYTHFTSPIRRYPDVMVHRILKRHLDHEPLSHEELQSYEALALQSSEREVSAVEAERDSIKLKQVEYMMKRVGETFEGVISGVTEWGIYVEEKKTLAEGLIRLSNMRDDYYNLDRKNYALVGERTKRRFRLGDPVKIRLTAVSLEDRTIDWQLVEAR